VRMDASNGLLGSGKGPPPPFSNGVSSEPAPVVANSNGGGAPHVRRLRTLKRKKRGEGEQQEPGEAGQSLGADSHQQCKPCYGSINRYYRLPRWVHSGSVQPPEKQTAAHCKPRQEDNNLSRMVRRWTLPSDRGMWTPALCPGVGRAGQVLRGGVPWAQVRHQLCCLRSQQ